MRKNKKILALILAMMNICGLKTRMLQLIALKLIPKLK